MRIDKENVSAIVRINILESIIMLTLGGLWYYATIWQNSHPFPPGTALYTAAGIALIPTVFYLFLVIAEGTASGSGLAVLIILYLFLLGPPLILGNDITIYANLSLILSAIAMFNIIFALYGSIKGITIQLVT